MMRKEKRLLKWRLVFILGLVQAIIALVWLLSIPSDQSSAIAFGLSTQRLILLSAPFLVALASALGLVALARKDTARKLNQWAMRIEGSRPARNIFFGFVAIFSLILIGVTSASVSPAVFERLLPILCLGMLVSLEIAILLYNGFVRRPRNLRPLLFSAGFIGIFILLGIWASPEPLLQSRYYSGAGAPILPYQFAVTVYVTAMATVIPITRGSRIHALWIPVLLCLFAAVAWSATPIPINHFTHVSNLAGGELFPYSDSRTYDGNAQQMLLGHGLAGGSSHPRPLYSLFVGWLHVLFGQSFKTILNVQTIVLAIIPAGIYLLGRRLLHPAAGLAAALFFIFRETNQALLSSAYTLSSSRMLMSEPFMVGCLVAFSIFAVKWLKDPENRAVALFTGALLGVSALVRTQALLPGAIVALLPLVGLRKNLRKSVASTLLFLLGATIVILPWMTRNYVRSDQFAIDNRDYVSRTILGTIIRAARWSGAADFWHDTDSQESPTPSNPSDSSDDSSFYLFDPTESRSSESEDSPTPDLADSYFSDPSEASAPSNDSGLPENPSISTLAESSSQRIVALLTNSNLSSLYQFPWKWDFSHTLQEYVANEIDIPPLANPYLTKSQIAVLALHLLMLSIGLASAWRKNQLAGVLPAFIYMGYNLSSVAADFSGWRFIQPADWILLLYWGIGFVTCTSYIASPLKLLHTAETKSASKKNEPRFKLAVAAAIVLGLLLPVGESVFPKQASSERAVLLEQIEQNVLSPNTHEVFELASRRSTAVESGVLLYPHLLNTYRDYTLNGVENLWPTGLPMLTFNVVAEQAKWYYAPNFRQSAQVEHYMSVIVVGCESGSNQRWAPSGGPYLPRAIAILVLAEQPYWLYVSNTVPESCRSLLGD